MRKNFWSRVFGRNIDVIASVYFWSCVLKEWKAYYSVSNDNFQKKSLFDIRKQQLKTCNSINYEVKKLFYV